MSIPSVMRALEQTSLEGPKDLRLVTDAPVPAPGPGEVLIRVTAAGVNFLDIQQARGIFPGGPQPPYFAGIEGAGEVVAVGEGVTDPELGAHVIGVGMPCVKATGWTTTRAGRKKRIYDKPRTPYQRLLAAGILDETASAALDAKHHSLNPAEISRRINQIQRRLIELAAARTQGTSPAA